MEDEGNSPSWPDETAWRDLLEPLVSNNPELADRFARLWYDLIDYLDSGETGVKQAREALETALRVTFPFTEVHKAMWELYEKSLRGDLVPDDEPAHILREALVRVRARTSVKATKRVKSRGRGRKRPPTQI